jgi:ketosteroid isomerase-like protein
MDRHDMLQTIQDAYAARVRGDLDGVMRAFAVDASFQINAAPPHPQLAYFTEDRNALRTAMAQLIDTFEFSDLQVLDSVVEGPKAVVRLSFTVKAKRTDKVVKTEVLDLFEFKDGKIAAMSQFCDTAVAAQLVIP